MGGDPGARRRGHVGGQGVPAAPPGDRARLPQRPRRWGAGRHLRPLRGPPSSTTWIGALSIRVAVSSGPLTAAWHAGRSRRPALSNKSGIDAPLQGARGDSDAGKTATRDSRASQTFSSAMHSLLRNAPVYAWAGTATSETTYP
jgi:hypothetical protein